jgi:class 3 adenylate cyclase/tetratricopeptide (TPR) repeat protein
MEGPRQSRRVVSVLFADVVGSTELGEELDPELVRRHVQSWFSAARESIERHGGTVEKFIGDAVMAVFGVPLAHEDDALRAVRAANDMRERGAGRLAIRIGVDTGEVVAGDPTSEASFVTGGAVNAAARLQAAAEPGTVLMGDATWRLVRSAVNATAVEPISAKGKTEPIAAWRLEDIRPGAEAVPRRVDGPMVGRTTELDRLRVALEAVRRDAAPRVVTVTGHPGIGKSRLVHEFLAVARLEATVLRARCLPYGEGITYLPVVDLVREAVAIAATDEDLADARKRIARLVEGIDNGHLVAERLSALAGAGGEIGAPQEVAWATRRMIEVLATSRPVVVVVDDLQWAESALIDLLDHVVDRARGSPILLVCIARPELYEAHPGWMRDRESALSIRLEPLTVDEGSELVDGLLGGLPLAPKSRQRIAEAADGNPLFIEQLLAMLVDDGVLAREDGRWVARGDLEQVAIPPSIAALLAARLDRLGSGERAALERASVVGKVFWWGAVADLAPEAEREALGGHLATLVRRDLVIPDASAVAGDEAFRFRHLLVRDAAYNGISKTDRIHLHERFAGWLERRDAATPDEYDLIAGYHLEQAWRLRIEIGDTGAETAAVAERALGYIAPAGLAANERGDVRAAASLLRRATNLCPPGRERIELLLELTAASWYSGDRDASEAAEAEAVEVLADHPDERLAARRRLREAWAAADSGGPAREAVLKAAEASYAVHERHGDRLGMVRALNAVAQTHLDVGELTASVVALDRATAIAQDAGLTQRVAHAAVGIAIALALGPTPAQEALERCRGYLELAASSHDAKGEILLCIGLLEAFVEVDRWRDRFDAVRVIVDEVGLVVPLGAADYPMFLAMAELQCGDPGRIEEQLRLGLETLELLGDRIHLATLAPIVAETLVAMGRLDEVEALASRGREVAAEDDLDAQVRWRKVLAALRMAQGRLDEALVLANEAVGRVSPTEFIVLHADCLLVRAKVRRAGGDEAGAQVDGEAARTLAAAKQNRAGLRKIEAFLAQASS